MTLWRWTQPLVLFIVVGGINTAVTLILFLALSRALPRTLAYTISYLVGIGLAYMLNRACHVVEARPRVEWACLSSAVDGYCTIPSFESLGTQLSMSVG